MDEDYDGSARLCRIVKAKAGYGFHLHSDKVRLSQFIHKVEPGSAAELAGVRAGDRILEVNGVNVEAKSHQEVVSIIKEKPGETTLLVIDPEADEALARRRATTAAGSLAGVGAVPARGDSEKEGGDEDKDDEDDHHDHHQQQQHQQQDRDSSGDSDGEEGAVRPRLCLVPRGPKGYGFHLHAEKGRVGQFVRSVDADSPAHAAGILAHDRIVQVNGQSIAGKKHSQVVALVKARKDDVTLLLVDRVADDFFAKCGVEPTPSHVKGRLPKPLSKRNI
ncbi:Na(+)/H(+) exchange regulatory cofactor NHE-RF2-like [Lethenteron reissneri]|uniref:Na(+)/H(+) exchange regulatory cofactor NHE-RF2-like n=1 Tax=Lethenteron reissneri TaxID=7753 RepID=UPI002AB7668E|nr:Na(+)/H(+) exchange regulatory cofactor NHE-RF2-like [Lethenteron reissneri]